MSRIHPLWLAAACLATLSASSFADTVTLKSGEKVEGKITAETDTEITIDAKVSANITDPRTIQKSEVASVSKEAPDETAWQPLKGLKLGANSLPTASYDALVFPLTSFATQFPQSPHALEAQKLAEGFAAEKKRVEAGEVKLDGKWLSKDEAQKERYQLSALLAFNHMKEQSTRDLVGALNTFDAIEKAYPGARSYPDAVDLAKRALPALKVEVDRRIKLTAAAKVEREKGVQFATGPAKTELMNVHKREQAAIDAAVAASEKQGMKWAPLVNSENALQRISGKIPSEILRLNALPVAKMRESIQTTEQARKAIEGKDFATAETALQKATETWNVNELAVRLRNELTAIKSSAAAAPEPTLTPPPPPGDTAQTAPLPAPTATASEEPAEEEKSFFLTPGGAIVVIIAIIVLIVVVNAFKKIRSKANELIE